MAAPALGVGPFRGLAARRFPALANLTEGDVDIVVLKKSPSVAASSRLGSSKQLFSKDTIKQVEELTKRPEGVQRQNRAAAALATAASAAQTRPPFSPANPAEARASIANKGFVSVYSPFDMAHRAQMAEREESLRLRVGPDFVPTSGPRGRETVVVNYFLNSPDAETIAAERQMTKERAAYNLAEYSRRAAERPGMKA